MNLKLKLVDDWKSSYKWVSIHCFILIGVIDGTWWSIPPDLKQSIPPQYLAGLSAVLGFLGVAARLLDQGGTAQGDALKDNIHVGDHQ